MKWLVIAAQIAIVIYALLEASTLVATLIAMMALYIFVSLIYVSSKEKIVTPIRVKNFDKTDIFSFIIIFGLVLMSSQKSIDYNVNTIFIVGLYSLATFIKAGVKNDS